MMPSHVQMNPNTNILMGWRQIGIILQKVLGNHIFSKNKSRSTSREEMRQIIDDTDEELHPLEIHTANYFKMLGSEHVQDVYTPKHVSVVNPLPSTEKLPFKVIKRKWNKVRKGQTVENNLVEKKSKHTETSTTYEEDAMSEANQKIEEDEFSDNFMTEDEEDTTIYNNKVSGDPQKKIIEFRKTLQEIKMKQTSVKNLELMADRTLRRVAKIRALANDKLRKLDHARNFYLKRLRDLQRKINKENF